MGRSAAGAAVGVAAAVAAKGELTSRVDTDLAVCRREVFRLTQLIRCPRPLESGIDFILQIDLRYFHLCPSESARIILERLREDV